MHLIKLNAIESTNTFLKEHCRNKDPENYTVVWALEQTKGRGQMDANWLSEKGKNLTFSILVKYFKLPIKNQFYISKAVSIAIKNVLVNILPKKISVKWPNDIMAGNEKIAGILIENRISKGKVSESIVGIGLNVNQVVFPKVNNAISMKSLTNKNYELESLLDVLVNEIEEQMNLLEEKAFGILDKEYLDNLYRFETPAMFQNNQGMRFMAKIIGVSLIGKLRLELEDESVREFDLKEVKYLDRQN